jgi:hypothetical protein
MSETCSACALVWPCPTPGPADARGAVASNSPHRSRVSPDDPDHPSNMPCPLPRRIETGASVDCFPISRGLPRITGGSASATYLSRPARASLALRPAGLLNRPRRPLSRGSNATSYPATSLASYQSNRQLSGWNLPPLVFRAVGAHVESRRGAVAWGPTGTITPFPLPAHRTQRADFPHYALRLASPQGTRRVTMGVARQPPVLPEPFRERTFVSRVPPPCDDARGSG